MDSGDYPPLTRREFSRIVGRFGLTSVLVGWSALSRAGTALSAEPLAATAASVHRKRYRKPARHVMTFGAAHFTEEGLRILPNGSLDFVADLEERTDGEIRIEYVGGNRLCRELACTKKCIGGEIDFFSASTQNASAAAPYLNILDFGYLWPSRASLYHFFYHPRSEALLREPLRKFHGIQFLFSHAELRGFMMGLKYAKKPKIMDIRGLSGAKIRVTGTQLGRIAMKLMGVRPVPVPWSDTLNALRIGAIDGAETWSSGVPYGKWGPVIAQDVRCRFLAGNAMSGMSLKTFEKLTQELRDAVMASAYLTQIGIQRISEAKLVTVTGITDPPVPGSYYHRFGIANAVWSEEAIEEARRIVSPRHNPGPWAKWRKRLDRMAGGLDIFEALHGIAREIPRGASALDIAPRRWWKG